MKVYIVTAECIYDYEQGPMEVKPFLDEKSAREFFTDKVKAWRAEAEDMDWKVEDDDEWCFSAGEMGYWCSNHMSVGLNEHEVTDPSHSWELQTDVESKAVDEIREMLGKTPNKEWCFGHDYCGEDGGGDKPFVMAQGVYQDDRVCEIGINAIGIDKKNDLVILYYVKGLESEEECSDLFLQTVMPQDYQTVARALWSALTPSPFPKEGE